MNEDTVSARAHYDLLIDEDNDPARDTEPLRSYMDKWDGEAFIAALNLAPDKNALEIGVGTGRLALRTAPLCRTLTGIDISPKTVERAKQNLAAHKNVRLICADFIEYEFKERFGVIYSSLTFMHIKEKGEAIEKAASLLKGGGLFALSSDKGRDKYIGFGGRKIEVWPDEPDRIKEYMARAGLIIKESFETEFAFVTVAEKPEG